MRKRRCSLCVGYLSTALPFHRTREKCRPHTPAWTGPPSLARADAVEKYLRSIWSIRFLLRFDGVVPNPVAGDALRITFHPRQEQRSAQLRWQVLATEVLQCFPILKCGFDKVADEERVRVQPVLPYHLDQRWTAGPGCPQTLLLISASCRVSRQ